MKFNITIQGTATLELHQDVIDVVDDEWREDLYDLHTPEEIAEMIGRCMMLGSRLSQLDGWADQEDNKAVLLDLEWETTHVEGYIK